MEERWGCVLVGGPVVTMEDAKLGANLRLLDRVCCRMTFYAFMFMGLGLGLGRDRFGLHRNFWDW